MKRDKRAYWVWLQHALGAGSSKPNRILSSYRTLADFYSAGRESWLLDGIFTQKELGKLGSFSPDDAQALIEYSEKIGQAVVTPECPSYPALLREIHNPPCALYVKGALPDFSRTPAISVVGTRHATRTGASAARSIAFTLAERGAVVVSGGALGIDTAAHQGALQAGGKTVCVLGCGIDFNYLMGNASLREAVSASGALISEYPPGTQAVNSNFPIRNRLISGISLGTLVVEAAFRSGSLITADYALEQGRDVFAVPAGLSNPVSQGVNNLIKAGAKPVSAAEEILEEYSGRFSGPSGVQSAFSNVVFHDEKTGSDKAKPEEKPPCPAEVSGDAAVLYGALDSAPVHISELARMTELPMPRLLSAVTELELSGGIRSYSGRRYSLPR